MLQGLLGDAIAEVRLLGAQRAYTYLAAHEPVSAPLRKAMGDALADKDPRIRQAAAKLQAVLADGEAQALLESRLHAEKVSAVRVALLESLGQLKAVSALPAVLRSLEAPGLAGGPRPPPGRWRRSRRRAPCRWASGPGRPRPCWTATATRRPSPTARHSERPC